MDPGDARVSIPTMATLTDLSELPDGLVDIGEAEDGYVFSDAERRRVCHALTGQACEASAEVHQRITEYVIPPKWTDVWIASDPRAYLQVTGRDKKGRKQYIYHPDYVAFRQRLKFARVASFAERLPALRREIAVQLRRRTWDRERMLALMVHLLDQTKLRIGNERYLARNKTFGLTTLRRKHLKRQPGGLALDFKGKSNKFRHVAVEDKRLRRLLREVSDLPGYRLFSYRTSDGKREELHSQDVNDYLREHLGEGYSAKDFRTWGGTSLAVKFYPDILAEVEERGKGKPHKRVVKAVAKALGNTVAVCREYYIHPAVLAAAKSRELPRAPWSEDGDDEALADYEVFTLELIGGA